MGSDSRDRRVKRSELLKTRRHVVDAVNRGVHPEDVAAAFEVGRSTVFKWLSMDRAGTLQEVKHPPGGRSRLTAKQIDQVRRWIVGSNPQQLQFELALWTTRIVADLIQREFGITYSRQRIGELLRSWGLSPQKPLVRAYEQDPERVAAWKTDTFPKIQARAKKTGASIYFADEAGARTDYHSGTTWGEVGRTPIVRGTGSRVSINMISAVSALGELHFAFLDGNANSDRFITFCHQLLHDIDGPIYLIVDGHSSHTSTTTRQFIADNDRIELYLLPPYSPELNPDEWVWKNIKHDHLGKILARTRDALHTAAHTALTTHQTRPNPRHHPEILRRPRPRLHHAIDKSPLATIHLGSNDVQCVR